MQEAHYAEPVSDGDDDDVRILLDEVEAVKHRVDGSARLKGTAVNPHHDGLLLDDSSALNTFRYRQSSSSSRWSRPRVLVAVCTLGIVIGLVDTVVGHDVHRGLPAQLAYRLLADVWNAPIGDDVLLLPAYESTVDTLHGQRLVVTAVGNRLVLAAVHGLQGLSYLVKIHCDKKKKKG